MAKDEPPKLSQMKSYIDEKLHRRIKARAAMEGLSMSELITKMAVRYLGDGEVVQVKDEKSKQQKAE